jgi:hypothetical protein
MYIYLSYFFPILITLLGSRCNSICLDTRILSQKETMILEIIWTTSWRIMPVHETNEIQRVIQPDTSLSATRSTVIPYALDNFTLCTPVLANTSHHAHVRWFVCFCTNTTQGNKVIEKQRPHTSTGTATGKNLDTASVNLTAKQRRGTWQDTKRRAKLTYAQSQYCEECDEQERKLAIAEERTRSYGTSSSVLLRKPTPILTGRRRTRSLASLRK